MILTLRTTLFSLVSLSLILAACSPTPTGPGAAVDSDGVKGDGDGGDGDGDLHLGDGDGDLQPGDGDLSPGDGDSGIDPTTLPATASCGDSLLNEDEACDDGNKESGDGCGDNCRYVEGGFICREAGNPCEPFAKCGDGVVSFPESCDDGNTVSGDGCTDNCKEEIGYRCDGVQDSVCTHTVCGDGKQEGAEACEHHPDSLVQGQAVPFNGCTVDTCQMEPNCTGFSCESPCGDGLIIGEEAREGRCDDGNIFDGDGCSSACEIEEGYDCTRKDCEIYDPDGDGAGPCLLRVPVIFRDLPNSFADVLPEYEEGAVDPCPPTPGLVGDQLNDDRKPVSSGVGSPGCIASADSFYQWYNDSDVTSTIIGELLLFDDNGTGNFVNRYGNRGDGLNPTQFSAGIDGNPAFFPLDGHALALPYNGEHATTPPQYYGGATDWSDNDGGSHNYYFTSEILYWFTYTVEMDATLTFLGDDDVFVFVNGHLALDLGGAHVPEKGSLVIRNGQLATNYESEARDAEGELLPVGPYDALAGTKAATEYGLQDGKVYQIKVFQAERKVYGSSFQLTLAGFNASRSDCRAVCGDGIIGAGEECDDSKNDGGYNECQADCKLGGFCGDGIVQENEVCDDADPNRPINCAGCRVIVIK